tara:strand:+ start:7799 stop:8212 length:414 start_codon:yes stop_codon:yes gene_type:complete
MKFKLVLLLSLITLIGYSQEPSVRSPKILMKIPLGKSILLEHHTIKFVEVLEDSRCPKDANCIWAGRAKILVEISLEGMETIQKEIIFGKVNPNESDYLFLVNTSLKKASAYQLNPYPSSEYNLDTKEYVLLIAIEN